MRTRRTRLRGRAILLSLALVATGAGGARSQEAPAPAQITLVPARVFVSSGWCNEFTVRAFDAGGSPVHGAIVDVLQTLTNATTEPDEGRELFFCDPIDPAGPNPTGQGGAAISDVSGNNPSQNPGEAGRNTTVRAEVGPTDAGGAVTFGIMLRPSSVNGEVSLAAWADLDGDDLADAGEPSDTSTITSLHGDPPVSSIDASPEADTNPNGTRHTVTVTATTMGGPVAGFVPDSVIVADAAGRPAGDVADPNAGTGPNAAPGNFNAYDCTPTNSQGVSTCTFDDPTGTGPGTDTVVFFADRAGTAGVPDADTDPQDAVQKTWVLPPPPPPPNAAPETDTNPVGTQHAIVVTGIGADATVRADILPGSANAQSQTLAEIACVRGDTQDPTAECAYTGTTAGTDTIRVFVDSNANGIVDQGERFDDVTKHWTDAQAAGPVTALNAEPETDTNPIGTTHQVTVTVTGTSGPLSGATPSSIVAGNAAGRPAGDVADPNAGASPNAGTGNAYACTPSNAQGVSTCTFDDATNPGPVGTDTIVFYVNEAGGTPGPDANEPQDAVQKAWTPDPGASAAKNVALCHDDGAAGCDTTVRPLAPGELHAVAALVVDAAGSPVADVRVELRETGPAEFIASGTSSILVTTGADGVARAVLTSEHFGTSTIVAEIDPPGVAGSARGPAPDDDACERAAGPGGSPPAGNCVSQTLTVIWEDMHRTICNDRVDNDGDGLVDYPEDPGCTSVDDDSETPGPGGDGGVFHDRIVHLFFDHTRREGELRLYGKVRLEDRGASPDCVLGRAVRIQRRIDGRWETLETATTNARRRFAARVADDTGRYRAVAVRAEILVGDSLHVCRRAKKTKVHRHRR